MNTVIEKYPSGRDASLDGLARCLERHIRRGPLRRVEIRLSKSAPLPLELGQVRARANALMRKHGHGDVPVSIRWFELPLDDLGGAHRVRVIRTPHAAGLGLASRWKAVKDWFFVRPGAAYAVNTVLPAASTRQEPTLDARLDHGELLVSDGCGLLAMGEGTQLACGEDTARPHAT